MIQGYELEISGYENRSSAIQDLLQKHKGLKMIELNRLAVQKKFRKDNLYIMMTGELCAWALANIQHCCPVVNTKATNYPYQFPKVYEAFGEPFKYEDTDPYPVQLYEAKLFPLCQSQVDFYQRMKLQRTKNNSIPLER